VARSNGQVFQRFLEELEGVVGEDRVKMLIEEDQSVRGRQRKPKAKRTMDA